MKIGRNKLKKNNTDAPGDCAWLIEKLRTCSDEELLSVLRMTSVETWSYGKCELHHWVDVLDRFDSILEAATAREEGQWTLPCNLPEKASMHDLVIWVLHFTTLLVEHSFSRHLYSSVEHLIKLLSSSSMSTILAVLNLLYMFSKRSNYITRIPVSLKDTLLSRLISLAESWGGKENGYGLAICCQDIPLTSYPKGSTTLHYEFYKENISDDVKSPIHLKTYSSMCVIHIENLETMDSGPSKLMEDLVVQYEVPAEKQIDLYTHLRLACNFGRYETRLQCVQARLQAMSILVYCNALQDNAYSVLYSGLLEEFVDVLQLQDSRLTEIKAATLRTLTSIIHLERQPNFPKLSTIIDVTGASSYHGFLPVLVRSCISALTASTDTEPNPFPAHLATSIFSFLYHLASCESGGGALVSCGMMESLLTVVSWIGSEPDHITFVTRAVRVIDLVTNLDLGSFHTHGGLNIFLRRLEFEVDQCRKEQPFVIQVPSRASTSQTENTTDAEMTAGPSEEPQDSLSPMDVAESSPADQASTSDLSLLAEASTSHAKLPDTTPKTNVTCLPQRAALLKSMLNFLKKENNEQGSSEYMRHLMEGSLPQTLKHIISNAEYYGPSLFLLATDVITAYVFGEPSLLSGLQDNGLTDVVLHALLVKDVPATKEVLGSLPNVFSALCLNSRGLESFVVCKPFERLFKVLLSPDYLPAMKRRRSSEPMGDTASNLGTAMDELMRHQPSLKTEAMKAIVVLLQEVNKLGHDSHYVCWKSTSKAETCETAAPHTTSENSSDEEEEEDEETTTGVSASGSTTASNENTTEEPTSGDKKSVPLVDYILNVMKFIDAILSNNSTDDHCKEFVTQKGLSHLLGILGLPNLPIDFAVSQACQSVSSVCKSILNLAHESDVLKEGLMCLNQHLIALAPLHKPIPYPGGSVLLMELMKSGNPQEAVNSAQSTPILHTLGAIHSYITMLVLVCRTSQTDVRQLAVKQWGSQLGLNVLSGLSQLYTTLVAESTILYAVCSEDHAMDAIKEDGAKSSGNDTKAKEGTSSGLPTTFSDLDPAAFSPLTRYSFVGGPFEATSSKSLASQQQLKLFKPLLTTASRLGKSLAELFSLLVKLCVGSPLRQRRGGQITSTLAAPSTAAVAVAGGLSQVLHSGLSWAPTPGPSLSKFRRTFLVCSIRFSSPMLFDDKKMPYHLMIMHFVKSKGLDAFFDIFDWALTTMDENEINTEGESEDISDGMGEFIDTWLYLLEKLVNPKTMLDSPHSLFSKKAFCPLRFLMHIQKRAFDSVMRLWKRKPMKNYGVKISEAVLLILCYIIKGDTIVQENLAAEKAEAAQEASRTADTSNTREPSLRPSDQPFSLTLLSPGSSTPSASSAPAPTEGTPAVLSEGNVTLAASGSLVQEGTDAGASAVSDSVAAAGETADSGQSSAAPYSGVLDLLEVSDPVQLSSSWRDGTAGSSDLVTINQQLNTDQGTDSQVVASSQSTGDSAASAASASGTESMQLEVLSDPHLQALLDMGFPQDQCLAAVERYDTIEQATDFLLSQPMPGTSEAEMEFQQEHWAQSVSMTVDTSRNPKPAVPEESKHPLFHDEDPLSKEKLEEFCSGILNGCLDQLEGQPQLVYKVCELLITCVNRNGTEWGMGLLTNLMNQIIEYADELKDMAIQSSSHDSAKSICFSENSSKFTIRLHLMALLFEEMKMGSAMALENSKLPQTLMDLIYHTEIVLSKNPQVLIEAETSTEEKKDGKQPLKWMAPTLLLLDLFEKLSISQKRRAAVRKVSSQVWKWFDVGAFRWYGYNAANNKIIDQAYWAGESTVRVTNGRRKYIIQFNNMLQINEETWNRRPIMVSVQSSAIAKEKEKFMEKMGKTPKEEPKAEEKPLELTKKTKSDEKMDCEVSPELSEPPLPVYIVPGFSKEEQCRLIRSCIGYMKLAVEPDVLHALMRVCLRLTREWPMAAFFSQLGGIRILLGLTERSNFWGFQTLASLLMRHVLETESTLTSTMKKVLRYVASSSGNLRSREMHSLLRSLAPAACRNTSMFCDVIKTYLRVDLNIPLKRHVPSQQGEEESIMMKTINTKGSSCSFSTQLSQNSETDKSEPQQLIQDLLEALTLESEISSPSAKGDSVACSLNFAPKRIFNLSRSSSANDMVVQDIDDQSPMESDPSKILGSDGKVDSEEQISKKKLLLSKAIVCKLLAEFVRSYSGVAKFITEHQFIGGVTTNVKEDCSALSYLLDLLTGGTDSELTNYVKVLISALASCNHSVDAQTLLVTEVKNSLSRFLILPECTEKHNRVQAIVSVIGTMMDSCPTQGNQPVVSSLQRQQPGMNNIVRIMLKKNLITDLARIPHCLDLASPHLAATVNVVLKPLETVLRIASTPSMVSVSMPRKKGSNAEGRQTFSEFLNNSEAAPTQDVENAGDSENNENDLSTAGENAEGAAAAQDDNGSLSAGRNHIDEIIEQLLGDARPSGNRSSVPETGDLSASVTYVIGDDTPMDTDDTLHDSRMVSHSESQFLDDNDPNNDDNSSDSSDDDHVGEENEVEDEDEDDDVDGPDEDDDDEEEDEEEGSVFDEGYEDLEEDLIPLPNDRENHQDLMYTPSYQRYISTIDTIIFGERLSLTHHLNTNMNVQLCNEDGQVLVSSSSNSASTDAVSVPPHPLFQNPRDINAQGRLLASRPGYRSRSLMRYQTGTPRSQSTTTNILQRLLGQTHREVLQLTSSLREVFTVNGGYPTIESDDFESPGETGNTSSNNRSGSSSSSLPPVPNALTRWMEEARVLEPESMHDAITEIKPTLMAVLEYYKDIEQEEKDKKKKESLANKAKASSKPQEGTEQLPVSTSTPHYEAVTPPLLADSSLVDSGPTLSMLEPPAYANPESVATSNRTSSTLPQVFRDILTSEAEDAPTSRETEDALRNFYAMTSSNSSRTSAMTRTTSSLPETTTSHTAVPSSATVTGEGSPRSPQRLAMSNLSLMTEQPAGAGARATEEAMCVSPPASSELPETLTETTADSAEESRTQPASEETSGAVGTASASTTEETMATTSEPTTTRPTNEYAAILGDIEIPEGVDPSFLAALPEDMRQEVIAEQLRIQQVQRASEALRQHNTEAVTEVSPEFLAALPPNIQEELLNHQRQEQERQEGASRSTSDDPAAFIQNLPSNLRETLLADIEESELSHLPPEVVQEAQRLRGRRERDSRRADGMLRGTSGSSISSFLRNTARLGSRFMQTSSWPNWNVRDTPSSSSGQPSAVSHKMKGQQVLDHEAVSCLLILLFVDEPRINTTRLHRVIKFLCCYTPTRQWIIKTLLSIIERCGNQSNFKHLQEKEIPPITSTPVAASDKDLKPLSTPSWLSMGIDAALGLKTNIFQLYRQPSGGKRTPTSGSNTVVLIHNQAAPLVCRHAVDLMISLAKLFPNYFLPNGKDGDEVSLDGNKRATASTSGAITKSKSSLTESPDFWEILMKLDSISVSRKSKCSPKAHINTTSTNTSESEVELCIENSPFGELVGQLAHPVFRRSPVLTDKLLRLLSLVSMRLSESPFYSSKSKMNEKTSSGARRLIELTVQVLTNKSCSEDGLEDVTTLLINLANGPPPSSELALQSLLRGASTLGHTVTSHIAEVYKELQEFNSKQKRKKNPDEHPQIRKGTLTDRFTKKEVIVTQSLKKKSTYEIQLPSMGCLTTKASAQAFFLRNLKVMIQLRDNIRLAKKKAEQERKAPKDPVERPPPRPEAEVPRVEPMAAPSLPSVAEEMIVENENAVEASASQEELPGASSQPMEVSQDPTESDVPTSVEAMDVDPTTEEEFKSLSSELALEGLWTMLSKCLVALAESQDPHAVLILQPAVEAFFLVHAFSASPDKSSKPTVTQETREAQLAHLEKEIAPLSPVPVSAEEETRAEKPRTSVESTVNEDARKFLKFAEIHRSVLNQILRQSHVHLADGPFRVLVDHTRLLDFDVKRKYFRTELERADEGMRKEDLAIHVRREHVFEDSFREIHRKSPDEWKNRFYIVFEGEEGQDAGGLLREWYVIISREIFNPMYALFCTSPGDRVTYMINPSSHCNSNHLSYFKFVGRVIAKAIYDNKLLECYFTRSFYKHILGKMVRVADMESEDYSFYQGLIYLIEHQIADLGYDLTFSTEVQEFGVTEVRDLKPNGRNITVTESTKMEYIRLVCQEKMTGAIRKQLNAFLEGFYDIIPKRLISIFNEQELELLISGLPTIDIEDLKMNTEYYKYNANSLHIQWFWRALRSFDQAERAKLVQFVTGTSKVPLQGFAALEGMNGVQKFQIHKDERSTDRLPCAHTCFNQLDLPVYETYDKLRHYLLKAIVECSEGFGFA